MPEPDGGWRAALAELAASPAGASVLDLRRHAALIWSRDVDRLLWSSCEALPPGWIGEAGAVTGVPGEILDHLRVLAAGLAPRDTFRLEKLRLGSSRLVPSATVACRLIQDGEALLTVLLDRGVASAADEPALPPRDPARDIPPEVEAPSIPPALAGGRRFTWEADREARFTAVSDGLPDLMGEGGSLVTGRTWLDLVDRRVSDEGGGIASALAAGRPWSRLPLGWRAGLGDHAVPVLLSGAPIRGVAGEVEGWRGFGIAFPEAERPLPAGFKWADPAASDTSSVATATAPVTPSDIVPAVDPMLGEAIEAAAALTGTAGDAMFGMIRALLGQRAAPAPAEPPPSRSAGDLSGPERGALHEIARALGARTEDAPDAGRPSAEIVSLPLRPREPDPGALLDRVPIGILVLRDGLPLFANRHLLDQLGGEDLPALVARGSLQPALDAAAAGEAIRSRPLALAGLEGRVRVDVAPVSWGDLPATLVSLLPAERAGAAEQAQALALDLGQRDERLGEMSCALDLAAEGAATLDRSARILWLSRGAERLFGYTAAELAGDSVVALLPASDHRAALGCLEELRKEGPGGVRTVDVRARSRSGPGRALIMRAALIPDRADGAFSVAFHDISRQVALEEDLRAARTSAERASANQADFLARVSHEIRTPITAIKGFAELMLEERFGPIGNERYRGYVHDIHGSGEHVVSLVNDLLDLAKVAAGKSELTPESVDLNAIVQQCVGLALPLSTRERTIVRTSFPPDLPRVLADERSVRQVALNILTNAIRYTGAGGQVIVATRVGSPAEIVLAVRDTGPGMEPKEIEAALTPFQRVAHTRRTEGTGLGLPLSKALVEANGGSFKMTSSRATGTLVEIRFPAAPPRVETIAAE